MESITLRFALPADAGALLGIYTPYIRTSVTFETEAPTLSEFQRRIQGTVGMFPYLVAQRGVDIVGYGYAGRYGQRAAYRWNAELSLYLRQDMRGHGLGKRLYAALIELVRMQGFRHAYAVVVLPNPASEHLQAAFGFEQVAVLRNAGYKCAAWRDVAHYRKQLNPLDSPPPEIIPIPQLDQRAVNRVLAME